VADRAHSSRDAHLVDPDDWSGSEEEREWRRRLILAGKKLQHVYQSLSQDIAEVRRLGHGITDVRPDIDRLEEELKVSRAQMESFEKGILEGLVERMREHEEVIRGGIERMSAPNAQLQDVLADLVTDIQSTELTRQLELLQTEVTTLREERTQMAADRGRMQARLESHENDRGDMVLMGQRLEARVAELESMLRETERGRSGDRERHAFELAQMQEKHAGSLRKMSEAQDRSLGDLRKQLEEWHTAYGLLKEKAVHAVTETKRATDGKVGELEEHIGILRREHEHELQRFAQAQEKSTADLRERLRIAEMARAESEARHTTEMAQFADHTRAQITRLEADLKKKKRGLAALTEQNIQLQQQVARLTAEIERLRGELGAGEVAAALDELSEGKPA